MSREKSRIVLLNIYNRRQKLLEMLYTPKELSDTLNVSREYIYKSLINTERVPITKDETGHVFINGMDVYKWITGVFIERKEKQKNRIPLQDNEFYCLKCKKRKITNDYLVSVEAGQSVKIAYCPDCGIRMRKYI